MAKADPAPDPSKEFAAYLKPIAAQFYESRNDPRVIEALAQELNRKAVELDPPAEVSEG